MKNVAIYNKTIHEIQCEKFNMDLQTLIEAGKSQINNSYYIDCEENENMFEEQSEKDILNPNSKNEEEKKETNNEDEEFFDFDQIKEVNIEIEEVIIDEEATKKRKKEKRKRIVENIIEPDLILLNPKYNKKKNSIIKNSDTECKYCGTVVSYASIKEHLNIECINQRLPCEFCNIPIHCNSYQEHAKSCGHNPRRKKKPNENNYTGEMISCESCGDNVVFNDYLKHLSKYCKAPQKWVKTNLELKKQQFNDEKVDKVHVQCNICEKMIDVKLLNKHERNHAKGMDNNTNFINPSTNSLNSFNSQSNTNNDQNEEIIIEKNALIRVKRNVIPGIDNSLMYVVEHMGRRNLNMNQVPTLIFGSNNVISGLDKKIINNFTISKFDKMQSQNFDEECKTCNICLRDFDHNDNIKFLPCTHRFHVKCIDPWLETHPTCPNCKRNLKEINSMI